MEQLPTSGERAIGRLEAAVEALTRQTDVADKQRTEMQDHAKEMRVAVQGLIEKGETLESGQKALAGQLTGLDDRLQKLEAPLQDAVNQKQQRRDTIRQVTVWGFTAIAFAFGIVRPTVEWAANVLLKEWFGMH